MKRENTSTKHNINSHFSLFSWKECFFCKQEFRRENGWYWVSQGRYTSYACCDCCKTAKECDEKIDSWSRNTRPPAPSAPPPKKPTR